VVVVGGVSGCDGGESVVVVGGVSGCVLGGEEEDSVHVVGVGWRVSLTTACGSASTTLMVVLAPSDC
jgi:hypothetical protein